MKLSNLDDLLLFVTLVEQGSFTKAAKKLHIAKSKLSRRLVQLEDKLGCELLLRTTRKQQLTESGRLLFCSSKTHIDALAKVEEELSSSINQPQGQLNILLPTDFFSRIISTLISDFLQLYPKIQLNCQHYSGAVPEFDPHFDLCFVLHEQSLAASNWIARELVSFPQSIYVATSTSNSEVAKLREAKLTKPESLASYECILAQEKESWLFRQESKVTTLDVDGRVVLSSQEMRLQACIKNLGLSKLPDYLVQNHLLQTHCLQDDSNLSSLQPLDLTSQPVELRLSVLYQSRKIAIKTRTFLDYFQSNVGQLLQ
jgi:DNA-binding transcriptional LysR family regulator